MRRALIALLHRELRLALRVGGGAPIGVVFFLTVVTVIPFGVGPDLNLLGRIGALGERADGGADLIDEAGDALGLVVGRHHDGQVGVLHSNLRSRRCGDVQAASSSRVF